MGELAGADAPHESASPTAYTMISSDCDCRTTSSSVIRQLWRSGLLYPSVNTRTTRRPSSCLSAVMATPVAFQSGVGPLS